MRFEVLAALCCASVAQPVEGPTNTVSGFPSVKVTWLAAPALVADDAATSDYLGASIIASADGLTLAAGRGGFPRGAFRGAINLWTRTAKGAAWTVFDTVTAPTTTNDGLANGWGPRSLALSDDGTVLVSASRNANAPGFAVDVNGTSTSCLACIVQGGVVWVWERVPGAKFSTGFPRRLVDGGPLAVLRGHLGTQVSISANGLRIVAGYQRDASGSVFNVGPYFMVWSRLRVNSAWNVESRVPAPTPEASTGEFGYTTISGDGLVIVASAPYWRAQDLSYPGQAYIYTRGAVGLNNTAQWNLATTIDTPLAWADGVGGRPTFGYNVHINGDGSTVLIAAAWYRRADGAVFVYDRQGTSSRWDLSYRLVGGLENRLEGGSIGQDLAMARSGNVFFAGAEFSPAAPSYDAPTGVVVRVARASKLLPWTVTNWIAPWDYVTGEASFAAIAILDSSGSEAMIGAAMWTYLVNNQGAIYQWPLAPAYAPGRPHTSIAASKIVRVTTSLAPTDITDANAGDECGFDIASTFDSSLVVMGCPGFSFLTGRVIPFLRDESGEYNPRPAVLPWAPVVGERFGQSIAMNSAGTLLVVAADCGSQSGAASGCTSSIYTYTWETITRQWLQVGAKLKPAGSGCGFDIQMSADGKVLAVGCPNSGSVLIYRPFPTGGSQGIVPWGSATVPGVAQQTLTTTYPCLLQSGSRSFCYFGGLLSMSSNGRFLAVGPGSLDVPFGNLGAAWTFTANTAGVWALDLGGQLPAPLVNNWTHFGEGIAMSSDGQTVAAFYSQNAIQPGFAIFSRQLGTWNLSSFVNEPEALGDEQTYGDTISFSPDGMKIAVGDWRGGIARTTPGVVFVYYRDPSGRYQKFYDLGAVTNVDAIEFGASVSFSMTGMLFIGATALPTSPNTSTRNGGIYAYIEPPPPGSNSGLAPDAVAGIAVGGTIVGVGALIVGVLAGASYFARRRAKDARELRRVGMGWG